MCRSPSSKTASVKTYASHDGSAHASRRGGIGNVQALPEKALFSPGEKIRYRSESFRQYILQNIFSGQFPVGKPLPARRKMSQMFPVSFGTVNSVISDLCREGYLAAVPRVGTVVKSASPDAECRRRKYRISIYSGILPPDAWNSFASAHAGLGDFFPKFVNSYRELALPANTGSHVEFIYTSDGMVREMARKKILLPLDNILKSSSVRLNDYDPRLLKLLSFEGRLYALPTCFSTTALFFNRDVFDMENIPYPSSEMTFDEFMELIRRVSKRGPDGRIVRYGLLYYLEANRDFLTLPPADDPEGNRRYIEELSQLCRAISDRTVLPFLSTDNISSHEIFRSGKAAMMIGRYHLMKALSGAAFRIGAAARSGLRGRESRCAVQGFGISSGAFHGAETGVLLGALCGHDMQDTFYRSYGHLPSSRRKAAQMPFGDVFLSQLDHGEPLSINFSRFEDDIRRLNYQFLYGFILPPDFLSEMRKLERRSEV